MRRLIERMSSFLLASFVEQKEIDKKLIKIAKKSFQCPIRGRKAIKRKIIKGDKKTFLEIEFSSCSAVFGERIHFLILLISFRSFAIEQFEEGEEITFFFLSSPACASILI